MARRDCPYITRAGVKLAAGLDGLGVDVSGLVCADFGCNVGGFTDCLLQRGAARVYALDTGYGTLAWKLRKDDRVVVMERTNALHAPPIEPVDVVVIDVGWTPQRLILPASRRWLKTDGQVISLLKPQYEASAAGAREDRPGRSARSRSCVLTPADARAQCLATCEELAGTGLQIRAIVPSPVAGTGGNTEFLLWAVPVRTDR